MQNNLRTGTLYVVATPIGNLNDMTLRAIEVLKTVDRIAAEDTRRAKILLNHFSIQKPMIALHDFNETEVVSVLLNECQQGASIALISDAGTPLISDPGYRLVKTLKEAGVSVVPIPGACAAIAALSAAGLPTDRFIFEGFLPAKPVACKERLFALSHETRTMIFYEAPHRVLSVLKMMSEILGEEREAVLARELTKLHEQIVSGTLQTITHHFIAEPETLRGEMVILLKGGEKKQDTDMLSPDAILDLLLEALPLKQAVLLTSKITKMRKNELYSSALRKKK